MDKNPTLHKGLLTGAREFPPVDVSEIYAHACYIYRILLSDITHYLMHLCTSSFIQFEVQ
jgi:hypothetical protein